MYKAAIIGCGHRAPAHIEAYQHIPGAEVVACCAPTPTRRDALAAKYGLHAYAGIGEMVRAERPDIVHLVTWPDTRVSLMTEVAELGVPLCTVEKPIATGVPDWRQLCALEARSKTRFAVCHQVRWHPYLMPCQDALRSGRLGRVRFLDISAGMNIAGQGTHTLNYGMSLMGDVPVASVFGNAHGWDAADPGHPGPATTEAYLTFADGGRGLWVSGFTSPRCGDPTTTWQHVRVAAYADNGRVLYEEFGRWEIVGPDGGPDAGWRGDFGGMDTWRANNLRAQAGFHRAMFDWLEDDRKAPGTNLRQSLHEWAVVLALYQSALERRPVELADFDPPDDLVERFRAASA
jgi:predicted dehydrogenase